MFHPSFRHLLGTLLLVAVTLLPATLFAQATTGTIKGTVVDQQEAPLAGVKLRLASSALQGTREVTTGEDGLFRFMALPPGDYRLDVEKEGYKTIIRPNLSLSLGRSLNLMITMELPEVGETVEVIDRRPVVDTEQTTQSVTLNESFLKNLPSGRSFQDAVQFLPGVSGGANPNINGGSMQSNQYYLDGTTTSDPVLGTFSMNFNFDAIEDLEVITAGYDARYNQGLGGTVNIVTKSGGNTFEADVSAYYQTSALAARGDSIVGYQPNDPTQDLTISGSLGGPIVKDRLWFFVAYNFSYGTFLNQSRADIGRDYGKYPLVPRTRIANFPLLKITAQPFARNKFTFTFRADPMDIKNASQSIYTLPEAEQYWRQGGFSTSLEHQAQIGGRVVLTTTINYQYSTIRVQPMLWETCDERSSFGACLDADKQVSGHSGTAYGLEWGSQGYYNNSNRQRISAKMDIEVAIDRALGSHTLYGGIEYTPTWARHRFAYINNEFFLDEPVDTDGDGIPNEVEAVSDIESYEPVGRYVATVEDNDAETGHLFNAYLQDRWVPVRGLTINGGGRFVKSRLSNNARDAVLDFNVFSGGLGVAWDPFRDGKTRISGNVASIADPGMLSLSGMANQGTFNTELYNWDATQQRYSDSTSRARTPASGIVHTDLVVPRTNEVYVSAQRELARDLTAQVDFLYRNFTNLWEDDEVNLVWDSEGLDVVGTRNGNAGEQVYRLRSPNDAVRRYYSFTVLVQKKLSDNFELLGSYTFSRNITNTSGRGTEDRLGQSSDFDNPTQRWHELGIAAFDRPHVVKLSAAYDNPNVWQVAENFSIGYSIGGVFEFASGTPLDRLQYNTFNQGYTNYLFKRGVRERLPGYANIDLRGTLSLSLSGKRIDFIVQVFNLLNNTEVAYGSQRAIGPDNKVVELSHGGPAYASPTAYYQGRRFEFGFRFSF